jgi:hypothetical protein
VDSEVLPRALEQAGFDPGPHFKAVIVTIAEGADGALAFRWFDHRGTATHADNWWPASTVKFPVAVAALERLTALGFGPDARITFHYEKEPVTQTVSEIVRKALIPSDNHSYDRLGEIVGFDELNKGFLSPKNGFFRSVLQRGYSGRKKDAATRRGTLRYSSALTLEQDGRVESLPERVGKGHYDCPEHGNCMPLMELAEAMRRVMLHEHLPKAQRFDLGRANLELLRKALGSERPRGLGVVNGLRSGFGESPIEVFHKPGFALDWFSDVVFVRSVRDGRRYIVAMAGYPGRSALDAAAHQVGALLRDGVFDAPSVALPDRGAQMPQAVPSTSPPPR